MYHQLVYSELWSLLVEAFAPIDAELLRVFFGMLEDVLIKVGLAVGPTGLLALILRHLVKRPRSNGRADAD